MNNQGGKRGRHRNSGGGGGRRGGGNPGRQNFDSNGPGVRIRGNASQILDKYTQLARDAQGNGDHVLAESMLQHAEHYYRILNADQPDRQQRQNTNNQDRYRRRDGGDDADDADASSDNQPTAATEDGEAVVESLTPAPQADAETSDTDNGAGDTDQDRDRRGRSRRDPRADRRRGAARRTESENGDNDGEGRDALARMLGAPAGSSVESDEPAEEDRKPRRGRPRKKPESEDGAESKPKRRGRPRRFESAEPSPELPLGSEGGADATETAGAE